MYAGDLKLLVYAGALKVLVYAGRGLLYYSSAHAVLLGAVCSDGSPRPRNTLAKITGELIAP